MTAPRFNILTQTPVVIDLSRPALEFLVAYIINGHRLTLQVADAGRAVRD